MRKCLDCGKELPDVAIKCDECGSENLSLIEQPEKTDTSKKPKALLILIIVILIIGIISSVIAYNYSAKTVPGQPIKEAVEAYYSGDIDGCLAKVHSSYKNDAENALATINNVTYSAFINSASELFGENYKVKVEVVDSYSFSEEKVNELNNSFNTLGYKINADNAKHIALRIILSGPNTEESYAVRDEYSIEVDGNWYFLPKDLINSASAQE